MRFRRLGLYGALLAGVLMILAAVRPTPFALSGMFLHPVVAVLCAVPFAFGIVLVVGSVRLAYASSEQDLFRLTKPAASVALLLWMFTPLFSVMGIPVSGGLIACVTLFVDVRLALAALLPLPVFYLMALGVVGSFANWGHRIGCLLFLRFSGYCGSLYLFGNVYMTI